MILQKFLMFMPFVVSVHAAVITSQNGHLTDLTSPNLGQFSQNASQGWIWDLTGNMPRVYHLTPNSLASPKSAILSQLQGSFYEGSFAKSGNQGWIWDSGNAMPYIYYLTPGSLAAPQSAQLNNLQSGSYANFFSQDASRGWIWDIVAGSPTIYYLTPDSLIAPLNISLTALANTYHASIFNPDATQGWIWDNDVTNPSLYLLSADSPTSPQLIALTYLTNAELSVFSADVSQGWIWDENIESPFVYYLNAHALTNSQFAELTNLGNGNFAQFNEDASKGWIGAEGGTAPYIYYLTPDSLMDPKNASLTNLQDTFTIGAFSKDVSRVWIWDYTIPMPYIYYLTPTSLEEPLPNYQMVYLQSTSAHVEAFSEDAKHGWIWDIDVPQTYIYYFSSDSPTNPQYTQLTNLTNGFHYGFDREHASQGWIVDSGFPTPYIYYLSAAAPESPQYTQLTHLQNGNGYSFSIDGSRGWIWDFNTPQTYIYYVSADTPTNPQYTQLHQLGYESLGRNAIFSPDATHGWIWDQVPSPYIYYFSSKSPTSPQYTQLTHLENGYHSAFSEDASRGWIWDRSVANPYVYYLSTASPVSPVSPIVLNWAPGLGGIWVNSALNSLLSLSKALELSFSSSTPLSDHCVPGLIADERDEHRDIDKIARYRECPSDPKNKNDPYSLYVTAFNDFIVQKKQSSTPGFTNEILGGLATFDVRIGQQGMIGAGGAYVHNQVDYNQGLGHANINQEVGVVYGSWEGETFFFNAACWGGIYQLHSVRKTSNEMTARSHSKGYVISPLLEFGADVLSKTGWFQVQPFCLFDWSNNWQEECREKGAAEMSLHVPNQYASLLCSEAGIRFYETCFLSWGQLLFEEKGSYINQTPFYHSSASTVFIESTPIFLITTGTLSRQNLGAVEFRTSFLPSHPKIPNFTISLQAEFGSSMQSYFAALQIGKDW